MILDAPEFMSESFAKKTISQPLQVLAWETLVFSLTLGLGIMNGYRLSQVVDLQTVKTMGAGQNLLHLAIYFIVGTAILVTFSSFSRFEKVRGPVFKVLFFLAVGTGALLLLEGWLPSGWALLVTIILIGSWWKLHSVLIHDLLVMAGIAGAGSLLGLGFTPELVVLLLVIFSIYDFIAVYKTKHMVKMAKAMVEAGSIVGLIIPSRIKDFTEDVNQVQPGGKFLVLGGGDIVFPLILCVSFIPDLRSALVVALFSTLGLGLSFWVFASQKIKKPIPALPPVSAGAIMGYLVVTFLV